MPDETPLTGSVERITFHNLDNGYVVLKVRAEKHRDVVTVVGHLSNVVAGEYIEANGSWVNDKTHGLQFKADQLRTIPPHTVEGITKYWFGSSKESGRPMRSGSLKVFGDKTLDVIDQSPTFLAEVKGIGPHASSGSDRAGRNKKVCGTSWCSCNPTASAPPARFGFTKPTAIRQWNW